MSWFKGKGPGLWVAAAFIGPGTVTVCSIAGAKYHFVLLWALVFSTLATMILQEMSMRLGLVAQKGLAQSLRDQVHIPWLRWLVLGLVLAAILLGNAAYEAGNISGAALGAEVMIKNSSFSMFGRDINFATLAIGMIAFVLLFQGKYKWLERSLIALVVCMSLAFVMSAILTQPDWLSVIQGLLVPSIPEGSGLVVMALIGTTVVPYNLFLHSNIVQEKWSGEADLQEARSDTRFSILIGGLVSIAIVITAAAIEQQNISNAAQMAYGLEPVFGHLAPYVISVGLFAAGISSAITAPLAAAYVTCESLGWQKQLGSTHFRWVWTVVLLSGIVISTMGFRPVQVIQVAQFANGLLLPLMALFLLWVMNQKVLLKNHTNTTLQNGLGVLIVLITLMLSYKSLGTLFGWI